MTVCLPHTGGMYYPACNTNHHELHWHSLCSRQHDKIHTLSVSHNTWIYQASAWLIPAVHPVIIAWNMVHCIKWLGFFPNKPTPKCDLFAQDLYDVKMQRKNPKSNYSDYPWCEVLISQTRAVYDSGPLALSQPHVFPNIKVKFCHHK